MSVITRDALGDETTSLVFGSIISRFMFQGQISKPGQVGRELFVPERVFQEIGFVAVQE